MSRTILYPTFAREKTVGDATKNNYLRLIGSSACKTSVSTRDLERLYHHTGQWIEGPCEVRWAWKYNDLKPRVYYAQGGDAYFASRYIRDIANTFCDLFPASNRQLRYNLLRLTPVDEESTFAIYDYASFTSELCELKYFMAELGDWCRGTTVKLVDTFQGLVEQDLGELILEYNESVNYRALMDLTRIFEIQDEERFIVAHQKSGMLGVYGNIVWSTALHGLFLTFIAGSFSAANVVGDDAGGLFKKREWSIVDLLETLRLLGIINAEKMEEWKDGRTDGYSTGWQFLKRPVDRISNHLVTGILFDIPLAIYVSGTTEDIHTADLGDLRSRIKAFTMQTCRLFDRMHIYESKLSEEEIDFALEYLAACYRSFRLPPEGSLPPFTHSELIRPLPLAIPILSRDSVSRPWLDVLIDESGGKLFSLPRGSWYELDLESFISVGQEFDCTSLRLLSLGEDLEFIEKRLNVVWYRLDGYSSQLLQGFVGGLLRPVYTWTYLAEPPLWWRNLSLLSRKN